MPHELPADLLTGHRKIDADHLKMYVGIRRLVSSVESSEDRGEWERQLNNLIATTWAHFAYEEKVMTHQKDGAHVFLHQMEHVKLIEDLMHVKERLVSESLEQLSNLSEFLDNWLHDHINNFDRTLVAMLVPADPILITDIPLF
jgi:hemerythrin